MRDIYHKMSNAEKGTQWAEKFSGSFIWLLLGLILVLFSTNIFFGSVSFPPEEICKAIFAPDKADATVRFIIMESRLPQAFTALLCGAALSACGLLLQTTFANPLADPSILGVNAGAGLGVAFAMLLFGGSVSLSGLALSGVLLVLLFAFLGSLIIIGVLLLLSSFLQSNLMLLIAGVMISSITASAISLLNYMATAEGVHSYIIWGMGNFSGVSADRLLFFVSLTGAGLIGSLFLIKPLNALLLGDRYATNLGFRVKRIRTLLLLITGLLTATVTAFCGPVSFLGLAVPHVARLLLHTSDHRSLLPVTLLCGSAIALLCNMLCTLPMTGSLLPLNVVTPLFGVPVVLYVILFRRSEQIQ